MEHYSTVKKNNILTDATRLNLKINTKELSWRKKHNMILPIWEPEMDKFTGKERTEVSAGLGEGMGFIIQWV